MLCAHLRGRFYTHADCLEKEMTSLEICSSHTKLTTLNLPARSIIFPFTSLLLLVEKESFGKDIFSTNKYKSVKDFGLQVDLL